MKQNTFKNPQAIVADLESQRRLSDERVKKLLDFIDDADSVELKLTVPDSDRASAISALDMDVLNAQIRQVVFFDTPDLRLSRVGIVVRARRITKGGDTVVKLRPIVPAEIPRKLRHSDGFSIEIDVMPSAVVCSGSLKGVVDNSDVKRALEGTSPIRKLFEPAQRDLYGKHAPRGLDLDSLMPFGPINVAKLKFSPPKLKGRSIVAEQWFYPDGSRILELSTKCACDETFQVVVDTRAFLISRGINLTGEQESKTHRALEHFAHLHDNGRKSLRGASHSRT